MISVEHLSIEFSSKPILDDISFLVNKKDRIALVGKNGAGKTTLLRLLAGEYEPTTGRISKDSDLSIGYLPQVMLFQDNRSLREEVMTVFVGEDEARFIAEMDRTICGLGFERKDFDRPCTEFSGGWRMRIELAKILLRHPDLILLDEPTNHLDMPSKDVLKNALKAFDGTVICVSHDRDFLDGLVDKVYEFGGGKVREHLGGIYDFLRKKKMDSLQELEKKDRPTDSPTNRFPNSKADYAAQKAEAAARRKKEKQIADTEAEIARLEQEQTEIEQQLNNPNNQTPALFERYEHIKRQIEQKMYEWEILSEL